MNRLLSISRRSVLQYSNYCTKMINAALIDLSGTLHIEDTAIPGASEALKRLRDANVRVKFVTNTTKEPLRMLHERLQSLDFKIERHEIFTSLTAAKSVVQAKNIRPLLFLEDVAKEDFQGIDERDPNGVVIGLAPNHFNYEDMNRAFLLLLKGAPLVAIHKARYYKKKDNLHLGPGGFISALEYATDVEAEVVGKPEKTFFMEALKDLDTEPERCVMIGDDVRDDVGGAMAAGMKGILVKTGKYRDGDEGKLSHAPSATCLDFPAAVEYILSNWR